MLGRPSLNRADGTTTVYRTSVRPSARQTLKADSPPDHDGPARLLDVGLESPRKINADYCIGIRAPARTQPEAEPGIGPGAAWGALVPGPPIVHEPRQAEAEHVPPALDHGPTIFDQNVDHPVPGQSVRVAGPRTSVESQVELLARGRVFLPSQLAENHQSVRPGRLRDR